MVESSCDDLRLHLGVVIGLRRHTHMRFREAWSAHHWMGSGTLRICSRQLASLQPSQQAGRQARQAGRQKPAFSPPSSPALASAYGNFPYLPVEPFSSSRAAADWIEERCEVEETGRK